MNVLVKIKGMQKMAKNKKICNIVLILVLNN